MSGIFLLEWNEIKGYDNKKDYRWQDGVNLPELEEEILIEFTDVLRPNRPPFVGYFKEYENGRVWIVISANDGMLLYEVQDGIKWCRFNRPSHPDKRVELCENFTCKKYNYSVDNKCNIVPCKKCIEGNCVNCKMYLSHSPKCKNSKSW